LYSQRGTAFECSARRRDLYTVSVLRQDIGQRCSVTPCYRSEVGIVRQWHTDMGVVYMNVWRWQYFVNTSLNAARLHGILCSICRYV